jgi:hypothetical protein
MMEYDRHFFSRRMLADYRYLRSQGISLFRAAAIAIRTSRMLRQCHKTWAARAQKERAE